MGQTVARWICFEHTIGWSGHCKHRSCLANFSGNCSCCPFQITKISIGSPKQRTTWHKLCPSGHMSALRLIKAGVIKLVEWCVNASLPRQVCILLKSGLKYKFLINSLCGVFQYVHNLGTGCHDLPNAISWMPVIKLEVIGHLCMLRPDQSSWNFTDDILKCSFLKKLSYSNIIVHIQGLRWWYNIIMESGNVVTWNCVQFETLVRTRGSCVVHINEKKLICFGTSCHYFRVALELPMKWVYKASLFYTLQKTLLLDFL